ncbi:MAG TPA: hypothetical protein PK762_10885 [Candidatus Kapabacteria bacterium]|nr:hypothetical protein [Candidatus Kapabacteria bacterium]
MTAVGCWLSAFGYQLSAVGLWFVTFLTHLPLERANDYTQILVLVKKGVKKEQYLENLFRRNYIFVTRINLDCTYPVGIIY